jgi:hypothetical protein
MNTKVAPSPPEAIAEQSPGELESLLRARSAREPVAASAVIVGNLVAMDEGGLALVSFPGADGTPPARLACPATADQMRAALETRQAVVLALEDGDPRRPLILGFVQPLVGAQATSEPATQSEPEPPPVIEVDVDGRRVRISAQDEIVLQCGSASITLRRNGRLIVRGTYVETHSEGTNRIKGGQVRIN